MKKGFTLVELVIVIVIVGILSIVAVPIYRGYVEKAKQTEGKALVGAIRTAQNIYYAEHGAYYTSGIVDYDPVLQIDARGNKYFKTFHTRASTANANAWAAISPYTEAATRVVLFWNTDVSTPTTYDGHELPVFEIRVDGKATYTNS